MTKLTSWLLAKGLEAIHGKELEASTDQSIDQRLTAFKAAYKDAFNGKPVTPEQRQKLNQAISDFISGNTSDGL